MYLPPPGQQNPSKYPTVGPSYQQYGEQPGWIYVPWQDKYYIDPNAQNAYYESQGIGPEKQPGMLEQVAPLAAAAGVSGLAQGFASDPSNFMSGIENIFSGASNTPVAEVAAQQAAAPSQVAANLFGGGQAATSTVPAAPNVLGANALSQTGAPPGAQAAAPSILGNFGAMGIGPQAGIAAGIGLGIKGASDLFKGESPSYKDVAKDPVGVGGRATVAIATGGLSELAKAAGLFGKPANYWKREGENLRKLQDKGVFVPDNLISSQPQSRSEGKKAAYRDDFPEDFIGRDQQGNWINNQFSKSRDVKDLRPEDIVNFSTWAENDPQWFNKPLEERLTLADQALQAGAVSEGKGQVKVDFKKLNEPTQKAALSVPEGSLPPLPQAGNPPRGTRLSPGVYADGKGGSYRA